MISLCRPTAGARDSPPCSCQGGLIGYGECTFGITLAKVKAWDAKHPDNPFPAGCFEPVKS